MGAEIAGAVTVPLLHKLPGTAAFGAEVAEITLRPPVGRDLRSCGVPYRVTEGNVADINPEAVSRLIAQLGGLPPSAVDALSAVDWQSCMVAILGFFGSADPGAEAAA
jgi:hypothetical protein